MSSRVGTSQVMSVPSRTEAASMYHLRLLQALMLLLRRGVRGGAGKRRTAARFNSWSEYGA